MDRTTLLPAVLLAASILAFTMACGTAAPTPNAPSQSTVARPTGPQADVPALDTATNETGGCTITYRDNGDGTTTWVATVQTAGELITHASDNAGDINRHDDQVTPGANAYTAGVPLAGITDIGGNLYVNGKQDESCSVGPSPARPAGLGS